MTRRCVYCPEPHDIGQCEPIADVRITHGMCDAAAIVVNARLDELLGPELAAKAEPLFFGPTYDNHVAISRRRNDSLGPIRPEWPRN